MECKSLHPMPVKQQQTPWQPHCRCCWRPGPAQGRRTCPPGRTAAAASRAGTPGTPCSTCAHVGTDASSQASDAFCIALHSHGMRAQARPSPAHQPTARPLVLQGCREPTAARHRHRHAGMGAHVAGARNTSQAPGSSVAASDSRTPTPVLAKGGTVHGGGARLMACSSVMGLAGLSACHFHPAFRSASPSTVRCAPGPSQRAPLTASDF